jgi:hypothetical protein
LIRTRTIGILLWLGLLDLGAQYISEVLEYTPAPGQYINVAPWGDGTSASSLIGGVDGSLSLGAFGGRVVFTFSDPVENHPDNPFGVDFTLFGNPLPDWSEPGVVWVMKDENENGEADDTWYELAGSDYYFSSTLHNYRVSYTNPGGSEARDVGWKDHLGNQGFIRANSAHTQSYYPQSGLFPNIPEEAYDLNGTLIRGAVDVDHPPLNISLRRAFGYADNRPRGSGAHTIPDNPYTAELENSGGDAFDISWAVDAEGHEVDLDRIHFIKVQSGMLHEGGWLGELSTEITGAVDVAPDASLSGPLDMLVIKDLPFELDTVAWQLELFLFHQGKPVSLPDIEWTCSEPWAEVDENHQLRIAGTGTLTLTASLAENPGLRATVSTLVVSSVATFLKNTQLPPQIRIYPNPARRAFRLSGAGEESLTLFALSGQALLEVDVYQPGSEIDIEGLLPGLYLLRVGKGTSARYVKLLKQRP